MLRRNIKVGFAATLVASALPLILAGSAHADYAPQPSDVVGVGGDTPQYAASFLADGDYNGDAGFNSSSPVNRLVTFNATADANGRSTYARGSTTVQLNPTVVLRAGTFPVQRISSSGNAISALLADTSVPETLNFVFSSSLPSPAQQTQAQTQGWGSLHVVEIGTDAVQIAADTTTNAPSGLSIQELLSIYTGTITKWNQLPGNSGGSGDTIIPLIPPSSSAIYKTFIASLTTANGNVAPTLSGSVQTVEQNDPTAITGASTPADAIVPFSLARLNLWNDGYFHNPNTAFPGSGTALTPGVSLLSGVPGDSNAVYSAGVTDYIIYRQSDQTSATPFEPGGTRNFVQTLFSNPGGTTPFVESNTGRALIASSGVTPVYNDLGAAHT